MLIRHACIGTATFLFPAREMTPTSERDDKRQHAALHGKPFRRSEARQGPSRPTVIGPMSTGNCEAAPVPAPPHISPPLLVGASGAAAAAAGVLGLLTFLGSIVQDKVDKAVAPLAVQLAEMEKRMWVRFDGLEHRSIGLEKQVQGMDSRLGSMDSRLNSMDGRLNGLENQVKLVQEAAAATNQRLAVIESSMAKVQSRLDQIHSNAKK